MAPRQEEPSISLKEALGPGRRGPRLLLAPAGNANLLHAEPLLFLLPNCVGQCGGSRVTLPMNTFQKTSVNKTREKRLLQEKLGQICQKL